MTDLTPSAAELAAITLNGRRLTPEQSSWLVGSLHHERAYCSTPGELLELLSHPTPPPAPEVEAIRDRARKISEGIEKWSAIDLGHAAMMAPEDVRTLLSALTAATQRAEAAERELTNANTRLESAALTLAEAVRERDEARDERKFAIDAFCDFVRVVEGAASTDAIDTGLRTAYRQINEALGTKHMVTWAGNDRVRCKLGELMRDDALKAPATPPAAPSELAPGEALKPSTIRAVTGNLRQLAKHMPKSLPGGGWIAEWGANIIEHQASALCAPASHPTADIKTHNVSLDNAAPSEPTLDADPATYLCSARDEVLYEVAFERGKRNGVDLCAPGSEAPAVLAYGVGILADPASIILYRVREREEAMRQAGKERTACYALYAHPAVYDPLPASPAAGKEAM